MWELAWQLLLCYYYYNVVSDKCQCPLYLHPLLWSTVFMVCCSGHPLQLPHFLLMYFVHLWAIFKIITFIMCHLCWLKLITLTLCLAGWVHTTPPGMSGERGVVWWVWSGDRRVDCVCHSLLSCYYYWCVCAVMGYIVSNVYFPWEKWSNPICRLVSMVSIHTHHPLHIHTHWPLRPLHTHSLLAGKVLLGITLLGKSCHYRSSPSPPCSHSSNNLIGQSSSHMTTQGSFIPPILSPRYRILGRWVKGQANRCWGRKLSTCVASVNLNH